MLIGYRCKLCGAPVDPETGYCHYCDTLNFKPIKKPTLDEKPRIIIRSGSNEATIIPDELSLSLSDPFFDSIGRDPLGRMHPTISKGQFATFSASAFLSTTSMMILSEPVFDVVFTGFRKGYGHEFQAYVGKIGLPSLEVGKILTSSFDIISYKPVDMWNSLKLQRRIPEGIKCPICGADLDPEKSKCDYCGYWWIYSPEGNI